MLGAHLERMFSLGEFGRRKENCFQIPAVAQPSNFDLIISLNLTKDPRISGACRFAIFPIGSCDGLPVDPLKNRRRTPDLESIHKITAAIRTADVRPWPCLTFLIGDLEDFRAKPWLTYGKNQRHQYGWMD